MRKRGILTYISSLMIVGACFIVYQTPLTSAQTSKTDDTIIPFQRQQNSLENNTYQKTDGQRAGANLREQFTRTQFEIKDHVSNIGTQMNIYIRNLLSAMNRAKGLSDEDKNKAISDLTNDAEIIQQESILIQRTENYDALLDRIQRIKTFWNERVNRLRKHVATIWTAKVQNLIDRQNTLDTKIQTLIERLEARGFDTIQLEALQREFKSEVDLARTELSNAESSFDQYDISDTSDENNALLKEGNEALGAAYNHIRTAHTIFKDLLGQVKSDMQILGNGTSTPEETLN